MLEDFKESKSRKYCEAIGKYAGIGFGLIVYLTILGYATMFKFIMKKISKEEKKDGISSSKPATNDRSDKSRSHDKSNI